MSDIKTTAVRLAQSNSDKQSTLDKLKGKKPRSKTVEVTIDGEQIQITFKAISASELDKLQAKHQPTMEQKTRGLVYNPNTFGPALIAACAVDPEMTEKDALEIWDSPYWSTGEISFLFDTCTQLCMEGMTVSFSKSD